MPKTWFQHDMNASKKAGLSMLLNQRDGDALYGKFWLLQEYFYFCQINNDEYKNTIRINENSLVKVLRTNRRRLGNIQETFRECLGIVWERFEERFGIVWETTMPNSLIYLRNRKEKILSIPIPKDKPIPKTIPTEETNTWRNDFSIYKLLVEKAHSDILMDAKEIEKQSKFYPNVDVKLSIEKMIHNFWGVEAGWKHKKKSRAKEIDMRSTLINNIDKNKVYYPRDNNKKVGIV